MAAKKKHIHFTGIAGTLIAPLAVAMKRQGWRVTGSDQSFYPPMSTYLLENKIKIIPGYNPDKFSEIGLPDFAVMMSFLTPQNPEIKFLIKKKIEIISLGQLLERYFIKKKSLVVAGNYGKTTITSLLGWILEVAGLDPTILAGGYMYNFKAGVKIGTSDWSVSEGDEFKNWHISKAYKFTRRPRLLYQKPTHVVFTDATWDHYDQYPDKNDYLNMFIKFIKQVPKNGFVVGNGGGKNVRQVLGFSHSPAELIKLKPDDFTFSKNGSEFSLAGNKFKTLMLGRIGAQNAALAAALSLRIGVDAKTIKKALLSYKGVKRRQDILFSNKDITVIDDFAHSPVKLKGVLDALRLHLPTAKIILAYQPGSKDKKALSQYPAKVFDGTDFLVLPRVSSLGQESRHFNALLAGRLKKTKIKNRVKYLDDDNELVDFVYNKIKKFNQAKKHVIVLFAAQKGWRGMIEGLTNKIKQ